MKNFSHFQLTDFLEARTPGKYIFETKNLIIGYFEQEMAPGNTTTCLATDVWDCRDWALRLS